MTLLLLLRNHGTAGEPQTQPGTVAGAAVELHASKAASGIGPGENALPLSVEWFDTSHHANHGTLVGFDGIESGWAGSGILAAPHRLEFDGAGDYAALSDLGSCEDKTYTWECWIMKPNASRGGILIAEYADQTRDGVTPDRQMVELSVWATTGKVTVVMRNSVSGQLSIQSAGSVCDGVAHHVMLTVDGTNARLYTDGVEAAGTYTLGYAPAAVERTTIGARRYGSGPSIDSYFPGSIITARIYPFALTPTEVAQNYAAGYLWIDAPLPAVVHTLQPSPLVDDSLWQILVGTDALGYRDISEEALGLSYSTVRPGGPASATFGVYQDSQGVGYNELQADSELLIRYAGQKVWDGFILPRGIFYSGTPGDGKELVQVDAAGRLARAKRRTDFCHVFVDMDLEQWEEGSGSSSGIQVSNDSGKLAFMTSAGTVIASSAYHSLWYHLHKGLSVEQDIYAVSFDWRSSGTMTWLLHEAVIPYEGATDWHEVGRAGGASQSTPQSFACNCAAGKRGLSLQATYLTGKTVAADEWLELTNLRVYGQDGEISIASAMAQILVVDGLATSMQSDSVS